MMKFIDKAKGSRGLLVWKLDRLARNPVDGGRIIWLLDREKLQEIRTWEKSFHNNSDDKFFMSLDFGIAKKYVDDLNVNVKRGLRARLEKGEWPGRAPIGYLNKDKQVVPDPRLQNFVAKAFHLYAREGKSLREVSDILYDQGFRTLNGYRYHKSKIHTILTNPFYYGVMRQAGKYYPGKYTPIISKTIYEETQNIIHGRVNKKQKKHFFRYRGLMTCNTCGCALTATLKKGHSYYYCTNGKRVCTEGKSYMRAEYLDELFAPIFEKFQIDEELIEICYLAKKEKEGLGQEEVIDNEERLLSSLAQLKNKQEKLLDAFIAESITDELYQKKLQSLSEQEASIKGELQKENKKASKGKVTLELVRTFFLDLNKAKVAFINAPDDEKHNVFQKVLWNLSIEGKEIASLSLRQPYEAIANRPKNLDFALMLGRKDSNLRMGASKAPALPLGYSLMFFIISNFSFTPE